MKIVQFPCAGSGEGRSVIPTPSFASPLHPLRAIPAQAARLVRLVELCQIDDEEPYVPDDVNVVTADFRPILDEMIGAGSAKDDSEGYELIASLAANAVYATAGPERLGRLLDLIAAGVLPQGGDAA